MKAFIFYRSSNRGCYIGSPQSEEFVRNISLCYNVEIQLINIDKVKYEKILEKWHKTIDMLYLCDDEEVCLDYIKNNYPNLELEFYSLKGCDNNRRFKFLQKFMDKYKASLEKKEVWGINMCSGNYELEKYLIDDMDRNSYSNEFSYYESEVSAKNCRLKHIESDLCRANDVVRAIKARLDSETKNVERLEKLLEDAK